MASGPYQVIRLPAGPDGQWDSLPRGHMVRVPVTRACGHQDWITVQVPEDLPVLWAEDVPCAACRRRKRRRP